MLDEPFSGVDPIAVGELQGFIRGLRDRGIGVLLTDHNVRETLTVCDRAYIINEGKVLKTGTPSEIGAAHDAVVAWCSAQRRKLTGVRWEIYGDPDPLTGHFDVAVYWQLA